MATGITDENARQPWLRRVGWLIAIWCLSVSSLGLAAYPFRHLMSAVGLSLGH